jgi:hypothetical protein
MINVIQDIDIHLEAWQTHTPNDGSGIGGAEPTTFNTNLFGNTRTCVVGGPAWATFMAYASGHAAPWLPVVETTFELATDAAIEQANLLELDLMATDNAGNLYNGSFQLLHDPATGIWKLQFADDKGEWWDSGLAMPPLQPNTHYGIIITHKWDTATKTIVPVTVTLSNGTVYTPVNPPVYTAQPSTWAVATANTQVQLTVASAPGQYGIELRNVSRKWMAA